MKTVYETIKKPLLTEKSLTLRDEQNRYSFVVGKTATKGEVKTAVEKFFNVTVTAVNTAPIKGKMHRTGNFAGRRADYKKAIVTLKKGDKIDVVEATAK